jgi:hypothetical protein
MNICKICRSSNRKTLSFEKPTSGEKKCPNCKETKQYSKFSKDKCSTNGCQTYCKLCQKINMSNYYASLDYKGFIKLGYNDLKGNAKKRGIVVNITYDDIIKKYDNQNGNCALTGYKMTHRRQELGKKRSDRYLYNISIDRIDSQKSYDCENIQLVCSIVNTIKWDLPQTEFIKICTKITEHNTI